MERYECTYRVNYNKQYLEDILDEECKGKKKLSNATLKKKDDSWEMDFHVMGPVKSAQRAPAIRHPIKADVAVKDGEISVVVPKNKVDPGIIFFYGGLNVLPLIFSMIALRAMYPDYALLWYAIFAVLAIVVVWAFCREKKKDEVSEFFKESLEYQMIKHLREMFGPGVYKNMISGKVKRAGDQTVPAISLLHSMGGILEGVAVSYSKDLDLYYAVIKDKKSEEFAAYYITKKEYGSVNEWHYNQKKIEEIKKRPVFLSNKSNLHEGISKNTVWGDFYRYSLGRIQDSLVESAPNTEYIKVLQQVISDWDFSQKASLIDYCNAKINIMDIVFEDEELKELLDDCYAFSYYYYYCFRFLNFERG
ncbi:MAG: hypothetical protein ACI4E1_02530 [Lachnospira sp.]